jgi:transcriptional regulator with XRE-family HTH domain
MLAYASPVPINHHWTVNFPEHLAALRKQKGMTQQQLADRVGVHVVQLRRYEAGTSQPTLDVIRSMAVALGISADTLLFAPDERGPDDALKLQFEAVSRFDPESKKVVQQVLDSMILQQEARRRSSCAAWRSLLRAAPEARWRPRRKQAAPKRPPWDLLTARLCISCLGPPASTEACFHLGTTDSRGRGY